MTKDFYGVSTCTSLALVYSSDFNFKSLDLFKLAEIIDFGIDFRKKYEPDDSVNLVLRQIQWFEKKK